MLVAISPAQAATVIDQSQTVVQGAWNPLNAGWSQSFTAGHNNNVGVGIFLNNFQSSAPSGSVTLSLYASAPNGSTVALASGTVAGTSGSWADVSWTQIALTIGQTYFIGMNSAQQLYSSYASPNPYAGGMIYSSSGQPFSTNIYDLAFRTFASDGAIAAVPEPATWALAIVGFAVMGATLRTRRRLATVATA